MEKQSEMNQKDIPLTQLTPTNEKTFKKPCLDRIRKSMAAIGMVESLQVYEEKSGEILIIDGNKRYFILLAAGNATAPCVLTRLPDTYTPSTQVINVSPAERAKMIKRALEKVTEDRIAAAIGVSSLKSGIDSRLKAKLHPTIVLAYQEDILSKTALLELKNVIPKRQAEILKELKKIKNYKACCLDVIRQQILETSPAEQANQKGKTPWQKNNEKRVSIAKRLEELENRREAMSDHYKIYLDDVATQLIYIRGVLQYPEIEQHIKKKYPEMYKKFRAIMDRE